MTCNCVKADVLCIDESGFEDQLTEDVQYNVLRYGVNSYLIENDKGEQKWYGKVHFV